MNFRIKSIYVRFAQSASRRNVGLTVAALVLVTAVLGAILRPDSTDAPQAVRNQSAGQLQAVQPVVQVPAPAAPAADASPKEQSIESFPSSPGPKTGNTYKLNADGQMPSVTKRNFLVSPAQLRYKGNIESVTFTVTTDDGRKVSMPSKLDGESLPYWIVTNGSAQTEQSSWQLYIDRSQVPNGTSFTARFMSRSSDGRGNEVDYIGSVNVTIPVPTQDPMSSTGTLIWE